MHPPDRLSSLLDHWQPTPSDQPGFAPEVHRRLAIRKTPAGILRGWRFPLAMPVAAALAMAIGLLAGRVTVEAKHDDLMAAAYARSIDPVQMTAHFPHP